MQDAFNPPVAFAFAALPRTRSLSLRKRHSLTRPRASKQEVSSVCSVHILLGYTEQCTCRRVHGDVAVNMNHEKKKRTREDRSFWSPSLPARFPPPTRYEFVINGRKRAMVEDRYFNYYYFDKNITKVISYPKPRTLTNFSGSGPIHRSST